MSHLPNAINIPSNPECVSCFSVNEDTTYLNGMLEKDKRELAEELLWLRETSKAALQESWNEVEDLRCQCAEYAEVETRLNEQLTESRTGEKNWRLRCLSAEKIKAMQIEKEDSNTDSIIRRRSLGSLGEISENRAHVVNNNVQQSPEKNPLLTFRNKMRSWSSGNLRGLDEPAKRPLSTTRKEVPCSSQNESFIPTARSRASKLSSDRNEGYLMAAEANEQQILDSPTASPSISPSFHEQMNSSNNADTPEEDYFIEEECFIETEVQTAGERSKANQFYLHGNAKSQEDLSLIISSRDEIITSLEQTLNQELNSMQNMQHEMMCLMETQRIKEKRISVSHKQKEERLDKLVVSLRGKLETNDIVHKKQDKNLSDCKSYIQELADELEKALKVVKRAEEGGFLTDCNSVL